MQHPPSLWLADNSAHYPSLTDTVRCDVAVIGGGISGVSAAWHLATQGARVVLLERGTIGSGSTGRSGGFMAQSSAYDLVTLIDLWGVERGLEIYRAILAAIDGIAQVVQEHNIDCGLHRTGAFYCAAEPSHVKAIGREYETLKRNSFEAQWVPSDQFPISGAAAAMKTPGDHATDPARLVTGLSAMLPNNASVFEHTSVSAIHRASGHVDVVTATGGRVTADHVVLATSGWSLTRGMRTLAVPFTSYIAVTEPLPTDVTARLGNSLLWDSYEVYHYLRPLPDGRLLIGGNDTLLSTFGLQRTDNVAHRLLGVLRRWFPGTDIRLQSAWSGPIALPADGLPVIETRGDTTMLITDGLLLGWMMGAMAAERIKTGSSRYDGLFDADRDMGWKANLLRRLPLPRGLKNAAMTAGLAATLAMSALDEKFFR